MNRAAAERAALAAIGRDLAAGAPGGGARRAAALLGQVDKASSPSFADLLTAPDWLRRDRDDQTRLARQAALFALAPALAASIDGAWLGEIARVAGEQALDRAMAGAAYTPAGGLPAVPADELDALGFDLLRENLPIALRGYLRWAPSAGATIPAALARHCVARATALHGAPEAAYQDLAA